MQLNIARFVQGAYSKLPPWAQTTVFFVLLGFSIYLYVAPRFINGQIVASEENGGFLPYRGVEIQTHIQGRVLKFQSSEDGFWSVPLVSLFPMSLRIQVKHEDQGTWHEVVLNASQIWSNDVRIWVTNEPPYVRPEVLSTPEEDRLLGRLGRIIKGFLISTANAAELRLPDTVRNKPITDVSRQKLSSVVFQLLSNITGKDATEIDGRFALKGRSAPTYVQRIRLISTLEKRLEIGIPDDHWRSMQTASELVDYLFNRKKLEAAHPKIYKGAKAQDWSTIQRKIPYKDRALFK